MMKYVTILRGQMWFLFALASSLGLFMFQGLWSAGIVACVLILRMLFLERKVWQLLLLLGCVLSLRFGVYYYYNRPILLEQEENVVIRFNPIEMKQTEFYWRGKGYVDTPHATVPIQLRIPLAQMPHLASAVTEQCIVANVTISEPSVARNFGVFDYRTALAQRGIHNEVTVEHIHSVDERVFSISARMSSIRNRVLRYFEQFSQWELGAFHNKLWLNLDSDHFQESRTTLAQLGILHLFAISGLHIHYISRWLRYILLRFGLLVIHCDIAVIMLIMGYAWLVRWPIGVIRVLFCLMMAVLCRWGKIPFTPLDQLSIVGLILLMWNPLWIHSLGFWLSFIMTFVLFFYSYEKSESSNLEMTLTCLLFSWPILIATMHEWYWLQLISVCFIGIMFERVVLPVMAMLTGLMLISSYYASWLLESVSNVFVKGSEVLAPLMKYFPRIVTGALFEWQVVLLLLLACGWLYFIRTHRKQWIVLVTVGYCLILLFIPKINWTTRITILDVEQGDAMLVQRAFDRGTWLIDTGGKVARQEGVPFDEGFARYTLLSALRALGVQQLDGIMITHPDADHMGNLYYIFDEIDVDYIVVTNQTLRSRNWESIVSRIPEDTEIIVLQGDKIGQLNVMNWDLWTLSEEQLSRSHDASNDSSIVTRMQFGQLLVLNTGDLSQEGEHILMREQPLWQADIIKLGHHGSRTSTSKQWLDYHQPQLALISAGYRNRYGHPHEDVLSLLEEHQIPYLSTSESGAIQLVYNELTRDVTIRTKIYE